MEIMVILWVAWSLYQAFQAIKYYSNVSNSSCYIQNRGRNPKFRHLSKKKAIKMNPTSLGKVIPSWHKVSNSGFYEQWRNPCMFVTRCGQLYRIPAKVFGDVDWSGWAYFWSIKEYFTWIFGGQLTYNSKNIILFICCSNSSACTFNLSSFVGAPVLSNIVKKGMASAADIFLY